MSFFKKGKQSYERLCDDTESHEENTREPEENDSSNAKEDPKETNGKDMALDEASASQIGDPGRKIEADEIAIEDNLNHGGARCKQEPNIQQAANSQDVAVTVQSGTDDGRKEIGDSRQSEVDIDTTGEGRQHVNVGDRRASEAETTVAIPTRDVDQGNPSPDIDTTGEVRQHVSVGDRRASEAEAKVATPTRDIEQDGIKGNRADVVSLIPELAVIGQEEQLEVRDCEEDFFS